MREKTLSGPIPDQDGFSFVPQFLKITDARYKAVFFGVFFFGFLAHGMGFFNQLSIHDDANYLFGVGATFTSGRWFLGLLDSFVKWLLGSGHYSLPLINGCISLLFLALFCCVLVSLLEIRRTASCFVLAGLLVSFPTMAALFSFMFTAPYYMLAMLMSALGAWLACRRPGWYAVPAAIALMACSAGIYQAYIPVTLSILLLYFIHCVHTAPDWSLKDLFVQGLFYIFACVGFVAVYFLVNQAFLSFLHLKLTGYSGISSMGKEGLMIYLQRIRYKIYNGYLLRTFHMNTMFPFRTRICFYLLLGTAVLLSLRLLVQTFRENIVKALSLALGMLLLPLAFSFIFVMCEYENVHFLMIYGETMFFVYLLWLTEHSPFPGVKWTAAVSKTILAVLLVMCAMYVRFDNIHYADVQFGQQRNISYLTTLVTRIKSTEGYDDTLRVVYVNEGRLLDETLKPIDAFDACRVGPEMMPYNYAWKQFMHLWCGFSPELADAAEFEDLPEVQQMTSYPDDGSIRVIDGTVVVKF